MLNESNIVEHNNFKIAHNLMSKFKGEKKEYGLVILFFLSDPSFVQQKSGKLLEEELSSARISMKYCCNSKKKLKLNEAEFKQSNIHAGI